MNYIGIKGHRGSGKKTVAFLLGQTLEYLIQKKDPEQFRSEFELWCKDIVDNEDIIFDTNLSHVYFDSFGDAPRLQVKMLLGCETSWLYDDWAKDHVVICLNDFTYAEYQEIPADINIMTADKVAEYMAQVQKNMVNPVDLSKKDPIYMTLREFILYFGFYVMQKWFGRNVWVKSYKANQQMYINIFNEKNHYRIFGDVKSPSEATYILEKGGYIINVVRPQNRKKNTELNFDSTEYDTFEIVISKSLPDLADTILNIAKTIISNNEEKTTN